MKVALAFPVAANGRSGRAAGWGVGCPASDNVHAIDVLNDRCARGTHRHVRTGVSPGCAINAGQVAAVALGASKTPTAPLGTSTPAEKSRTARARHPCRKVLLTRSPLADAGVSRVRDWTGRREPSSASTITVCAAVGCAGQRANFVLAEGCPYGTSALSGLTDVLQPWCSLRTLGYCLFCTP